MQVTNPELAQECEILRQSGTYQISSETNGARRLTLRPMQQYGVCGNPLFLSALTLGILPGTTAAGRVFEYDLETDGVMERYAHYLPLYQRVSVWEWLVRRDEQKVYAQALAWSAKGLRAGRVP